VVYQLPDQKRCPVCRHEDSQEEVKHIAEVFKEHPELDNHEYD